MTEMKPQQVFILPEGYSRMTKRDAQRMNIMAAKIVAETIRTTLGPKGMDKMLVDSMGDITITNDGATILDEMDIEHPAAKMLVEIAKTQDEEVGDGTTTAVVIAGELLKKAEELLEQDVHPTVITKGYDLATKKAERLLKNIVKKVSVNDTKTLLQIAKTAIGTKGGAGETEEIAKYLVDAVQRIVEEGTFDPDNIKLQKKIGKSIDDSELVNGIIIDKERASTTMPSKTKDAKIALLSCSMEIEKTETDAKISITSPNQLQAFLDQEETMIKNMVEKVKASGANVVFCQKGIDDVALHFLSKAGILTLKNVSSSDMSKLARATGGSIIKTLDDLSTEDLGNAKLVEEVRIGNDTLTFVRECKNPKAVSILIRGGTEHVISEVERALKDAIGVLKAAIEDGTIVAGGGSAEMALAKELSAYAQTLTGREQLAVKAFAESLEAIPRTLAENAGLDPIDVMVNLKAAHEQKKPTHGVDVFTGRIIDMLEKGIVEPARVKQQAIQSAGEVAMMILRIDDTIAASKSAGPGPGGMPPGAGGMPPGMGPEMM